jgi:hypothetical protein
VSLNPKCVSLNPKRFSNHKNLGAAVPFKGIALLVALWIGLDSVLGHRCNFSVWWGAGLDSNPSLYAKIIWFYFSKLMSMSSSKLFLGLIPPRIRPKSLVCSSQVTPDWSDRDLDQFCISIHILFDAFLLSDFVQSYPRSDRFLSLWV